MIHVLPKVLVWAVLIGIAYLAFGPDVFDSTGTGNPLHGSPAKLYLPPAKPERLIDYEQRLSVGKLEPGELAEYRALSRAHQGRFWQGKETSVEDALFGVENQRGERLASVLSRRGLTKEEQAIFFTVLRRDHPELLEDRE